MNPQIKKTMIITLTPQYTNQTKFNRPCKDGKSCWAQSTLICLLFLISRFENISLSNQSTGMQFHYLQLYNTSFTETPNSISWQNVNANEIDRRKWRYIAKEPMYLVSEVSSLAEESKWEFWSNVTEYSKSDYIVDPCTSPSESQTSHPINTHNATKALQLCKYTDKLLIIISENKRYHSLIKGLFYGSLNQRS